MLVQVSPGAVRNHLSLSRANQSRSLWELTHRRGQDRPQYSSPGSVDSSSGPNLHSWKGSLFLGYPIQEDPFILTSTTHQPKALYQTIERKRLKMHKMVKNRQFAIFLQQLALSRVTLTLSFGKTKLLRVLAHSWVRWIATSTNVGVRHSLLQFCKRHCRLAGGTWGLPHWLSRTHFPTNFTVSLWLCPEMRDVNFFRWLQSSSGDGEHGVTFPVNLTCPTSWQGKMNPTPWCKQDLNSCPFDTLPSFSQGLEPWSQLPLGRVNTDAFPECGHRNELISIPWAYDKGSTKGIYFNMGLIT